MKLLSDIIDAFRHADGPPPDRLGPFLRWALDGAFPAIFLMLGLSIAAGVTRATIRDRMRLLSLEKNMEKIRFPRWR